MLTSRANVRSPRTLEEALAARANHPDGVILAGGTDLMVQIEAGQLNPSHVIDLSGVGVLRGIQPRDGYTWIGALTTYTQLIHAPHLATEAPSLVEAARACGALQIQNRGTLGGNIGNASPAGDTLPVLLSLDAVVELASARRGLRLVPAERFFVGYRALAMKPDEIITGVRIPQRHPGDLTGFRKVGTRAAQAISKVVMAARLRFTADGIQQARIAFGSVAPTPVRCPHVERALEGGPLRPGAWAHLSEDIAPIDDVRSSARYRMQVATNVLRAWLESLG